MAAAVPLAIGAAGLAGVGSAYITSKSNRSIAQSNLDAQNAANATNLQAVRETNASNYNLWKEQNSQAWKMFDAVNEYNTPVNQASRLSAAGINPLLAMSGQNSGSASAVSLPNAPQMQAPQVNPVHQDYMPPAMAGILEALGNVPSQYAQMSSSLSTSQIASANATIASGTTQYKIEQEMARLKGMVENNKLTKARRLQAWTDYKYYDTFLKNRNLQQEMQYNLTAAQYNNTVAQSIKTYAEADSASLLAKFQHAGFNIQLKQLDATLRETYARIAQSVASKDMTIQQTKKLVQDTFTSVLQNEGLQMDNSQKKQLLPLVVKSSMENLNKVINQVGTENRAWQQNGLYRSMMGIKNYFQGFIPLTSPGK